MQLTNHQKKIQLKERATSFEKGLNVLTMITIN